MMIVTETLVIFTTHESRTISTFHVLNLRVHDKPQFQLLAFMVCDSEGHPITSDDMLKHLFVEGSAAIEVVNSQNEHPIRHGTSVTSNLDYSWLGTNRVVCGDSYF